MTGVQTCALPIYSNVDSVRALYKQHKDFQKSCYEKIIELQLGEHSREYILEELTDLRETNERYAEDANRTVHEHAANENGDGTSISVQLNTNWEIKQALATMIAAMESSLTPDTLDAAAELTPDPALGA